MYEELNRRQEFKIYGKRHLITSEGENFRKAFIYTYFVYIYYHSKKKGERCHCEASDSDDFPPSKTAKCVFYFI